MQIETPVEVPPTEPERSWFLAGARAEARERESRYDQVPAEVHHLMSYAETLIRIDRPQSVADLLVDLAGAYRSRLTWADRRRISRAMRGKSPFPRDKRGH